MLAATAFATAAFALVSSASAQTGVSDDRVSLPDGPGSMEGIGDNATIDANMGAMTHGVDFELPRGFAGMTPELGLAYSSSYGNGIAGIGWYLPVRSIERLTLRGLPTYDADDEFAADGFEQLVRISSSGGKAIYRSRFEGAFVRYTWHDVGDAGYWVAEYPDGRIGYFGADSSGTLVPDARLEGDAGETFRYSLVEVVDVFGHRMRFEYERVSGVPYLASIGYAFGEGDVARYRVDLGYESRPDPISDAKPGFEERVTRRLVEVQVSANSEVIRSYRLGYEADEDAGGLSRLVSVERFGRDGGRYPIAFTFGYSRALGGVCTAGACEDPFVVDMGTLPIGGSIHAGDATLVDINGDALPDLLDTSQPGAHRFVLNRLEDDGTSRFDPAVVLSTVGDRSGFRMSDATVQVLDLNGDGFSDLINTFGGGSVLCNYGTGDWSTDGCVLDDNLDLELTADEAGEADPRFTRFLDVDNDRRIDVVRTGAADQIVVSRNHGAGFEPLLDAEPIGAAFDEARLLLADINGDGLLDPVQIFDVGSPQYRLNLGFARWGDWTTIEAPDVDLSEREYIALEDLNDDGRDDFVLVTPGSGVRYALNLDGLRFGELVSLGPEDVPGLPTRSPTAAVLYADMNGNGSRDVVWIETSGSVRYLELFPIPPNLLSRIENGIGSVEEIHYDTAVAQRHADETPWSHPLAHPMNVVERIDTWVTLTGGEGGEGLHDVTRYRYRDGYYHGDEKAFRGFARVESFSPRDSASDSQEPGRVVLEFDVGDEDAYRYGRELRRETFSGEGSEERALEEQRVTYDDCEVAGLPGGQLLFDVRYVCETERTTIRKEGAPAAEWATLQTTSEHDGYGNVVLAANLGVVHMGSPEAPVACGACDRDPEAFGAPCGESCLGDEAYVATEFVVPGTNSAGRYMLGRPFRVRGYGREGGAATEQTLYYDGPDFVGLSAGRLTLGNVTRVTARVHEASSETIDVARSAYDADGNVVTVIDPNGTVADPTTHRRSYEYDSVGLRVIRTDVHVRSLEDAPYLLRREYSYDPAFDQVSESTAWMVFQGEATRSARNATRYRYDEFGRRIAIIQPGDTEAAPTAEFSFELAAPASSVRARMRSVRGGALDLESIRCIDGRGRDYQLRTRIDADSFQVSGFAELNGRGAPLREYEPHVEASGDCAIVAPDGIAFETVRYDAAHREIGRTYPDASLFGSASASSSRFEPLSVQSFDEEDTSLDGLHGGTPTITHVDGLGRTIAVERRLTASGVGAFTRAEFDELGRLASLIDAEGNEKQQRFDLLGRIVEVDDPNSGSTVLSYDSGGNLVSRRDARGVVTRMSYDAVNRIAAQWDEADPSGTEIRFRYDIAETCSAELCAHTAGRLVETAYPIGAAVAEQLGGAGSGLDTVGYDARGQIVFRDRIVAGRSLETRFEHDNYGRLLATIHPDGRRIERAYDGASRPISIGGIVEGIDYDDRGLPRRLLRENGASDEWEYDVRARIRRQQTRMGSGDSLEDVTYDRDRVGNIIGLAHAPGASGALGVLEATFAHDAWYRVTGASRERGAEPVSESQFFAYDDIDNVASITSEGGESSPMHVGDLSYDAMRPNAVVEAGELSLRYDLAGNLTKRGEHQLSWDFLGRLTAVDRDDEPLVELSYGAGLARVATVEGNAVTIYVSDDYEIRDGIGVLYARLGDRRVARLESDALATGLLGDVAPRGGGDGVVRAADGWVAHAAHAGLLETEGIDASAKPAHLLRSAARRLLLEASDGAVHLHADALGSLVAATDALGAERGRRRFAMLAGEDRSTGFVDVYGFSGQEHIASIGLVRYEHRWLDPVTRRWTRPDPLFAAVHELEAGPASEMADPYAYVRNGFVTHVDPTGLMVRRPSARGGTTKYKGETTALDVRHPSLRAGFPPRVMHQQFEIVPGGNNETWRDVADGLPSTHDSMIYVLHHEGRSLKVGKTTGTMSRFSEYQDAADFVGMTITVDLYAFKVSAEPGLSITLDAFESAVRSAVAREIGGVAGLGNLPWDNTGGRLGRPGSGTPGVALPSGWAWNGEKAEESK